MELLFFQWVKRVKDSDERFVTVSGLTFFSCKEMKLSWEIIWALWKCYAISVFSKISFIIERLTLSYLFWYKYFRCVISF